MMPPRVLLLVLMTRLSSSSTHAHAHAHDVELGADDEHEFTYGLGTEKGPENWGNLKPEWQLCEKGRHQSPIDLNTSRVTILSTLGHLARRYKPAPASVINRGHDIMVEWKGGDAGGFLINGTTYRLLQCHWHTPSEHAIGHKRFRMELHMVHKGSHGNIAVMGIVYKLGRPDPFIAKILDKIKLATENGTSLGEINPWEIKFGSRKYFTYMGSLTVPPCTEGVVWSILHKVRTVSMEQITTLYRP